MITTEIPVHTHAVHGSSNAADQTSPITGFWPTGGASTPYAAASDGNAMAGGGGRSRGRAHENRPPYLVINFAIALAGIFPSRRLKHSLIQRQPFMSDPFPPEIRMFGFNFPPRGWAACDGQLMPIAQNTALFSLLGVNYGGDGRVTFGLPDLRGNVPVQQGQAPGLSPYDLGETGGEANVTLLSSQIPPHSHPLRCSDTTADQTSPVGAIPAARRSARTKFLRVQSGSSPAMNANLLAPAGKANHNNMPPYLSPNFCIALAGTFPARP